MSTPGGRLIGFGPRANCTLALCSIQLSVFQYRPSLAANVTFLVLFGIAAFLQLYQGIRSKQWFYGIAIILGCICEIIGYIGRVLLHGNPFVFSYFLIQIICLTLGPAFYSAAIYFTLTKICNALGPNVSRFDPKWYYWAFIPCDLVSLVLQAAGGGLSAVGVNNSVTTGRGVGVYLSIAGLSFQVLTLCVFIGLVIDYMLRWRRHGVVVLTNRFRVFAWCMSAAVILILARCAYRIGELSQGYTGSIFHDEASFIVVEGVFITISVYLLTATHPMYYFDDRGGLKGKGNEANVDTGSMAMNSDEGTYYNDAMEMPATYKTKQESHVV